jgi:tetratricopeptide (TPR) repeat protein
MASCNMAQKKFKEAQVCLEQAVKHCRKNWKIWENLIILCLDSGQYYKAVSSVKQLLKLDQDERVNGKLMARICDCFVLKFAKNDSVSDSEYDRAKASLIQLFEDIIAKNPKCADVLSVYFII